MTMRTYPALLAGMKHPEAFCRMLYRTRDGAHETWVWNSRDGVTPFCIHDREGREMHHVEWHRDDYQPDFIPPPGSLVFVTLTADQAHTLARRQVERFWNHATYPMRQRYVSREAAAEALADHMLVDHGAAPPHLVEVAPEGWPSTRDHRAVPQ